MAELGGRTPREMMISVSKRERALHGNDIFTRELMRTTLCCGTPGHTRLRPGQVWVVPDLGTDADFAALCEQFDAVHVHLTRAGCDYAKDSRRPLTHIPHLTLCNPGTPDFVPAAVARVRTLLV